MVFTALAVYAEHQERPTASAAANGASTSARVAVLGASGYTGAEVVRLLAQHPTFAVTALTGESNAGKVSTVVGQCYSLFSLLGSAYRFGGK